jgi:hypothetical protein
MSTNKVGLYKCQWLIPEVYAYKEYKMTAN